MKFIILGSRIDNLINAYYLAKKSHDITIIENEKEAYHINENVILFSNESNILNDHNICFKSKILSIFYQKQQNKQFNDSVTKNIINFDNLIESEQIALQNQHKGLLYVYKNKNIFQKKIEKINSNKNYKIFNIDNFKETGLRSEYIAENLPGIILSKNSLTIDKNSFINELEKICKNKYKIKFEKNLQIKNILNNHHKITGINTNKKVFVADQYIVTMENTNINLLKSINLDVKINNHYQIIFYVRSDNVKNKIKYSMEDPENNCSYYKNGDNYIIKININKDMYNNFNNKSDITYFSTFKQLEFLEIKDYKKINYQLFNQKYFPNQKIIQKSKKYNNLFLNANYDIFNFDEHKILSQII